MIDSIISQYKLIVFGAYFFLACFLVLAIVLIVLSIKYYIKNKGFFLYDLMKDMQKK